MQGIWCSFQNTKEKTHAASHFTFSNVGGHCISHCCFSAERTQHTLWGGMKHAFMELTEGGIFWAPSMLLCDSDPWKGEQREDVDHLSPYWRDLKLKLVHDLIMLVDHYVGISLPGTNCYFHQWWSPCHPKWNIHTGNFPPWISFLSAWCPVGHPFIFLSEGHPFICDRLLQEGFCDTHGLSHFPSHLPDFM